jgi:hypothetical protein
MSLATALKALGAGDRDLPEAELAWCLANWEVARPALTQALARFARNPAEASDADALTSWFALFLLAQKRDAAAMPTLRKLLKDPDGAASIFADDGSMALTRVVASLFDGDIGALMAIVEDEASAGYVFETVLEAAAWLAAAGATDRAVVEQWIDKLPGLFAEREDAAGSTLAWGFVAARLGRTESVEAAKELLRAFGDEGEAAEELDMLLRMALEEPDPLAPFARDGVGPVDDAIADLKRVIEIGDALAAEAGDEGDERASEPVVNEFRAVGRNDPCPCGSGKKFKKCCLAA